MECEPPGHRPVLPRQVTDLLAVQTGDTVLDVTVGLGGHAELLTAGLSPGATFVGLDLDPRCLEAAGRQLADCRCRVELIHSNFAGVAGVLDALGISGVDVLFADLGVNSVQLDDVARGFSFLHDGPLDMRMNPESSLTAADLVNRLKERELGDLLYYNAQEMGSRRIARFICRERREARITTTGRLAGIVADALGVDAASRKSKIHPATRTFLALRMAVNDEIPNLARFLDAAPAILKPGGRIGVIAFHSVEDKAVKTDFRKRKAEGLYSIVTNKPVVADADERRANPRSRSAKLRVAARRV